MNRKIIDFYLIVSNLKNVIRTGWEEVKIPKENIESVMDHVGGTMLLAMAINNEKNLDLDMNKVYTMILVKELAKAYTNYEYSVLNPNLKEDYNRIIKDIFGNLSNGDYLFDIYNEYTLMNSKESKFVFKLSKLESDIQAKKYELDKLFTLDNAKEDIKNYPEDIKSTIKEISKASEGWIKFDRKYYDDELFNSLSKDIEEL